MSDEIVSVNTAGADESERISALNSICLSVEALLKEDYEMLEANRLRVINDVKATPSHDGSFNKAKFTSPPPAEATIFSVNETTVDDKVRHTFERKAKAVDHCENES